MGVLTMNHRDLIRHVCFFTAAFWLCVLSWTLGTALEVGQGVWTIIWEDVQ